MLIGLLAATRPAMTSKFSHVKIPYTSGKPPRSSSASSTLPPLQSSLLRKHLYATHPQFTSKNRTAQFAFLNILTKPAFIYIYNSREHLVSGVELAMEGENPEAFGYPPTQINLASGSSQPSTINPGTISTGFGLSQNIDAEFSAFEANTPTGIAPPNVHAQNNQSTADGNLKRKRGRPLGSKNKPKVDATLSGPKQPKQPKRQAKPVASSRKAKSSPQSARAVAVDRVNLPEGGNQDIVLDPALVQNTPVEGEGLIYN